MFQVGEIVYLIADPSRRGPIIEILQEVSGKKRYRVFLSAVDMPIYFEDQITHTDVAAADPFNSALLASRWIKETTFRARLTAVRLSHPLTDSIYALHAARVKHIPFQFKPLLRFLRADRPRLLIADEVGVGKTIEAGLILKELESRQEVDNVLIVCPKPLTDKWRAEMRRFDADFQILTPESLRYCINEAHLDGVWPSQYSRSIVNLELLRADTYMGGKDTKQGLLTLDPSPQFSLIVLDEAHHVRTPHTNSYEVARFLCDTADAVIFLTATPIQIGSENLFQLLNLLRPDLFQDFRVFESIIEPNSHINRAIRITRTHQLGEPWQAQAATELELAAETTWGKHTLIGDERYEFWRKRLRDEEPLSDADKVGCIRDLEELHTLAHIVNRTRRRDIGRFTLREPHTIAVPFTPLQQQFYEELIHFRQELLSLKYGTQVARMITDTLERQASSCLPAMTDVLNTLLDQNILNVDSMTDTNDFESDNSFDLNAIHDGIERLRLMARRLPNEDPKLDGLLEILRDTQAMSASGKVLVFSFFLHTLHYLYRELERRGYRVGLITGRLQDEERERLRELFSQDRAEKTTIDVLLSSEVGCEGLDYQFCDRLVNYDIPWNPMRIEQRIGRIDRYGQLSDKVLIFNFITPGTVEERIYFRCFDRLGIFKDTIGDLEEIMGNVMVGLETAALNAYLTPEQAATKAVQTADNVLRLIDEHKRLEDAGFASLGTEYSYTDEIVRLETSGSFVSASDLHELIQNWLEHSFQVARLAQDGKNPTLFRLHLGREARNEVLEQLRVSDLVSRPAQTFRRWLESDSPVLDLTFNQETAADHRNLEFITPLHPLVKLAVNALKSANEPLVACLETVSDGNRTLLVVIELWENVGIQPAIRIVTVARDIESSQQPVSLDHLDLLSEIRSAKQSPVGLTDEHNLKIPDVLMMLEDDLHRRRVSEVEGLRRANEKLLGRQLNSLDLYYKNRLERLKIELQSATEERIQRMKTSEVQRIQNDYQSRRRQIEARRNADIVASRLALVVLKTRTREQIL